VTLDGCCHVSMCVVCVPGWSCCRHYDAVIDEVLPDGTCTVTFDGYGNTEVTQVMASLHDASRVGHCMTLYRWQLL